MEHLEYEIQITAPVKTVWDAMLQKPTYEKWVAVSWPNSSYEGKWAKGEKIKFIAPEGSGTLADLEVFDPHKRLLAKHVAVLLPGGIEDSTSEAAKGWVGTTEEYQFSERDGITTLKVLIGTAPEWRKMFDDGWPAALAELKRIAEDQLTK